MRMSCSRKYVYCGYGFIHQGIEIPHRYLYSLCELLLVGSPVPFLLGMFQRIFFPEEIVDLLQFVVDVISGDLSHEIGYI